MPFDTLHRNAFHVLGATTRDGRARVMELAEERALVGDEEECREAQNALINLRGRLAAEMAWFPGVSPRKASELSSGISASTLPGAAGDLPPLARANALAAHLESLPPGTEPSLAAPVILKLSLAVEEFDPAEAFRDINEDRSVAGYQPVRDESLVVEEFEARKREYGTPCATTPTGCRAASSSPWSTGSSTAAPRRASVTLRR